jgi:DNA-binding transcriptional LysR family regulator
VSPTRAGQALHEDAMRILGAAEGLPGEAQRVIRAANGRCVIGMIPTPVLHDIVTRAVREASIRMPEIALTVLDVPTPMQPDALASARIDLGLGHSYPTSHHDRAIVQSRLADDALNTALLAVTSPLAKRESLTLANLADIPFLFMKRSFSPAFYDQVMGAFARVGYRPRIDVEYDGLPTVWALAAKNIGWCLASQSQRKQPPPGLVAVPLREFELPWGAHLVCREDEFSQAILAIRDLLLQTAASTPGEA